MPAGEWHHVVGVYDGADLIIYFDGDEVARTNIGDVSINTSTGALGIGSKFGTYWNGSITLSSLYKVEKSGNWVKQRFERTKGIFGL